MRFQPVKPEHPSNSITGFASLKIERHCWPVNVASEFTPTNVLRQHLVSYMPIQICMDSV